MNNHKKNQKFLCFSLLLALAFSLLPLQIAGAIGPTTWYVRNDGSDTALCAGKNNASLATATAAATTNCAFATISKAVSSAAAGEIVRVVPVNADDSFYITSTILLNKAIHLVVQSGATLRPGGSLAAPLFQVSANNVRISGEKGAYAVYPRFYTYTGATVHAILVNPGVDSLVVDNIKFDGMQTVSSNPSPAGIYFANGAAPSNLQIVDNMFVSYKTNPAIRFYNAPTGVVDIQGNSFAGSDSPVIKFANVESYADLVTANLSLAYNSWGSNPDSVDYYTGQPGVGIKTAYSPGEDISALSTISNPITRGLAWLVSEQSRLISEQDIEIRALVVGWKLNGVSFIIKYPKDRLVYKSISMGQYFGQTIGTDYSVLTDGNLTDLKKTNITFTSDDTYTYLHFHTLTSSQGSTTLNSGMNSVDLATFTFTGKGDANVTASISLVSDPYSYDFSMAPPSGPSNKIYGTVNNTTIDIAVKATTVDVLGAVSMQGRITRNGVIEMLGSYSGTSSDQMVKNVTITGVPYANNYQVTILKYGYLGVTSSLGKHFNVTLDSSDIRAIELKGGDANGDNTITVNDANLIGTDYGLTGHSALDNFTDINSSGKVDILDLALMGGNYDTDSEDAYASWTP